MKYVHTNIVAKNWKVLVDFYCGVFECVPVPPERKQSGDWLARGTGVPNASLQGMHLLLPGHGSSGPTLEIYQYEQMEPRLEPKSNRQGLGHLAFSVDDIASVREKILQAGGAEIGELSNTLVTGVGELEFIYMADPEGNIIELQKWTNE